MILKVTSQGTRINLTSWRNLSRSEVSGSRLLRSSTQFCELLNDASVIAMEFMMLNRLCIPAPFSEGRIFETGEETIFELNQNKGNYLSYKPILFPN